LGCFDDDHGLEDLVGGLSANGWMFFRGGIEMVTVKESQVIILMAFSPHIHRYTHSE
jgi:hypothetical protein